MIRTNLSTRPFYNERTVNMWLLLAAAVVVVASLFNVSQVLRFSGTNTELVSQASTDAAMAAENRRTAASLRASVDRTQIDNASVDARQANDLIDRRTFSWTELFNRFETTLPDEVRITSVTPRLDKDRRILLSVVVVGRTVDDVNTFMEHLDATGAFIELRSSEERTNDQDQIESVLEMVYQPEPASREPRAAASTAATEGR